MAIPIESNIAFYDNVAAEYNFQMSEADSRARQVVADIFMRYLASGPVLDFGGGTGLDIPWLSSRYDVYFLEPSANMRSVALAKAEARDVIFLKHEYADYANWRKNSLPFSVKVVGVLANFAVFNCIELLAPVFEKIALVMLNGGYLFATIIDPTPWKMAGHYGLVQAVQTAINGKGVFYNQYRGKRHPTFLHSRKSILKAANKYFEFHQRIPLPQTTFSLFIFRRK